jgi:trans-aconitate methyltransferase
MGKHNPDADALLSEQIAYYRAIAPEYEQHAIAEPGLGELFAVADAFRASGHVLELACGPGAWTERLVRSATSLTAVDAAAEMIARAKARVADHPVRFVHADLFTWQPDRRYDSVFFGFWLSHVPVERFDAFWSLIASCLEPSGRVFFVDDAYRTPEELIEGEASSTIRRRLKDGTPYRAVKVPYRATELEARLDQLGWRIQVTQTAGPFYWGAGGRAVVSSG